MGERAVPVYDEEEIRPYDPGGSRTRDLRIKSPLLYQLSYRVGDVSNFTCWNYLDNSLRDADVVMSPQICGAPDRLSWRLPTAAHRRRSLLDDKNKGPPLDGPSPKSHSFHAAQDELAIAHAFADTSGERRLP